jgi:hypothetical protein
MPTSPVPPEEDANDPDELSDAPAAGVLDDEFDDPLEPSESG